MNATNPKRRVREFHTNARGAQCPGGIRLFTWQVHGTGWLDSGKTYRFAEAGPGGPPVRFFLFRQGTRIIARGFLPMDTHDEQLSDACQKLHDAEARITRQQKLAETFHMRGHLREARRAREILAAFVRSYFLMQDYRQSIELDLRDHSPGQL